MKNILRAKGKKAQNVGIVVKLVIALVVIGMLIYIAYRYILGTGENVGKMSGCDAQGGKCIKPTEACGGPKLPGLCEDKAKVCCVTSVGG